MSTLHRQLKTESQLRFWINLLCHCIGSPLYWEKFHSSSISFLLLIMASAKALLKFAFSVPGAGGVEWCGTPQHNSAGAVWPYMREKIGLKKWIDVTCRTELVYLVATGCFVVAMNIFWCRPLWDGMTAGRVSSACGKCLLKFIENDRIVCQLVCVGGGGYSEENAAKLIRVFD